MRAALFFILVFCLAALGCGDGGPGGSARAAAAPAVDAGREVLVASVIDGDTFTVRGGERVRLLGIDTPELGEPYYTEAKKRSAALLRSGRVVLRVCAEEPSDSYGRTLAWVEAGALDVNATLLKEGLARALIIPPCGLKRGDELRAIEREAKRAGLGLWGRSTGGAGAGGARLARVEAKEAASRAGKGAAVRGTVARVRRTPNAIILEFKGTDFSAVIFKRSMEGLDAAGVRVEDFIGRAVTVSGRVRIYKGRPEIVVKSAGQIIADGDVTER